ncbi:MAG: hypothetical protein D6689_02105 [Deltaproteobacteria bacterium]|nr:MAG: hypothetical protein D6689_02105 [Deltaproteobacteria bacterium]
MPIVTGGTTARVRRLARATAPWLVAAAILAAVAASVDRAALASALAAAPIAALLGLMAAAVAALVAADVFALWVAVRAALPATPLSPRAVLAARAPSYLLALLNYGAGAGGFVYLLRRRHGIPVVDGIGAVGLATGAFLLVLAAPVGIGLAGGAVPEAAGLRWLVAAIGAGGAIAAVALWWRPAWLADRALLRPMFDAGLLGTARAAAARVPYVAGLLALHWAALRLFGVRVAWPDALARLPVIFLLAAVPISPAGLGTTQAASVVLLAEFAPGATADARAATVLAYSLSTQVVGMALWASVGLLGLRALDRRT